MSSWLPNFSAKEDLGLFTAGCLLAGAAAAGRGAFSARTLQTVGRAFAPKALPDIGGIAARQKRIAALFNECATKNDWSGIRNESPCLNCRDCKCCIFPGGRGGALTEGEVEALRMDPLFMMNYEATVERVSNSWGYSAKNGAPVNEQWINQLWYSVNPKDSSPEAQLERLNCMMESTKKLSPDLYNNLSEFRSYHCVVETESSVKSQPKITR